MPEEDRGCFLANCLGTGRGFAVDITEELENEAVSEEMSDRKLGWECLGEGLLHRLLTF